MVTFHFLALMATLAAAAAEFINADPHPPQVTPIAQKFEAGNGLPPFSLRLGNDTASVCNSSTPGISGYIDTDDDFDSHMFFWFFESKNEPLSDPLILWMSGGPGASSAGYGNLMELGPCRIAPRGGGHTVDNPFSWNKNASVLFIDQPVSVGFSTGKGIPHGLSEASMMTDRFMRQFIVAFPQLRGRDFYIAGESYGGSWVPALAATILKTQGDIASPESGNLITQKTMVMRNTFGSPASLPHLQLKGIMIGNGLMRLKYQNPASFEAACSGPNSLLSAVDCVSWAPWAMWCELNIGVCETAGWLSTECKETHKKCMALDDYVLGTLKRNPYNWDVECSADDMLECFPELRWIDALMNSPDVKAALGVDEHTPFRGVSSEVWDEWERLGDTFKPSAPYVNELLDSGIRVLIYAGDKDFLATAAGMRRLVNEGLAWKGHPLFRFRELVPWYHETNVAGRWKGYGGLTYAEVFGSGHLTPFDLPGETLSLINGWLFDGSPPSQ